MVRYETLYKKEGPVPLLSVERKTKKGRRTREKEYFLVVSSSSEAHTRILRVKEKKRLKNPDRAEEVEYGRTHTQKENIQRIYKKYD